ncbi:hypothetical protein AGMMS49574_19150 [Bacteroidia bacterium]|nr:hypothetical protein AGMMS49574_19150 [Bacteroidia bacterium]
MLAEVSQLYYLRVILYAITNLEIDGNPLKNKGKVKSTFSNNKFNKFSYRLSISDLETIR